MDEKDYRWNIVVVIADTLRPAYLGAYGNDWISTPNRTGNGQTLSS